MRAFNYIPPRETSGSPVLQGATNILKYYNELNAVRQQQQQKRINTIMSLANELDYASTISQADQLEQIELREKMMDQLTEIVKQGRSKDGGLSDMDVFTSMNVIKETGMKIGNISKYQKMYHDTMDKYYKEPGKYRPGSFAEFNKIFISEGGEAAFKAVNPLQEKPLYFEQWKPELEKGKKYRTVYTSIKGTELSLIKSAYVNPKERDNEYKGAIMSDNRKMEGLKETFVRWGMQNPDEYSQLMNMNNGDASRGIGEFGANENKAAIMYGIKYQAPRLAPDFTEKEYRAGSSQPVYLKQTKLDDGTVVWDAGANAKTYNGKVKTLKGDEQTVMNGKITKVVYDPKSNDRYIELVANIKSASEPPEPTGDPELDKLNEIQYSLSQMSGTRTRTFYLPYEDNEEMVNSVYNLEGIDKTMRPKNKEQPVRKKIEW